ncbi:hypothetical protein [Fusibacter bizertensis]
MEQPKFIVSEEVIKYLKSKKKSVLTFDITLSGGGCCGFFEIEDISYEQPKNIDYFYHETISGIEVYVTKRARFVGSSVHFDLLNGLLNKSVTVTGVQLIHKV